MEYKWKLRKVFIISLIFCIVGLMTSVVGILINNLSLIITGGIVVLFGTPFYFEMCFNGAWDLIKNHVKED